MTYIEFIENILNTRGRFNIPDGEYKERHHVTPRCLGGQDTKDNLIDLYAREHFIAHKLLHEENQDNEKLTYAYWMMAQCNTKDPNKFQCTPEEYEEARLAFVAILSEQQKGAGNSNARGVVRLADGKTYLCIDDAADDCQMHRDAIWKRCKNNDGFMYYDEYVNMCNNNNETIQELIDNAQGQDFLKHTARGEKVVRIDTLDVYDNINEAANANGCPYRTMLYRVRRKSGFMYYRDYILMKEENHEMLQHYINQFCVCGNNGVRGEFNPQSRKVIRLGDLKVYGTLKDALKDNNVSYRTLINRCKKCDSFMYYDEYEKLAAENADLLADYVARSNYGERRGGNQKSK